MSLIDVDAVLSFVLALTTSIACILGHLFSCVIIIERILAYVDLPQGKIIRPPKLRRFMLMSFLAFLGVEGRMTEVLHADSSLVGRMLVQAALSNLIQATPAKYEGG
jgi:hypothetical protein